MALQLLGVDVEVEALITLPGGILNSVADLRLSLPGLVFIHPALYERSVTVVTEKSSDVSLHMLNKLLLLLTLMDSNQIYKLTYTKKVWLGDGVAKLQFNHNSIKRNILAA